MIFIDWQFTAQDDEFLDPALYQYREAFVPLDAMYRDTPVMSCPYIYVDNDVALARGWTQGFPKKMGSIFQTHNFAAASPAAAPVVSGGQFGASLSTHGERLAEACVTLRKPVKSGLSLLTRRTVLWRYFPRLAAGYQDKPAVDELTMSITDNLTVAEAWVGEAELVLPEARGEELHALAPKRVESGFRYSLAYSVKDLKITRRLYPQLARTTRLRHGEAYTTASLRRRVSADSLPRGPLTGRSLGPPRRIIVSMTASEYVGETLEITGSGRSIRLLIS
jgi:hypothetical protein